MSNQFNLKRFGLLFKKHTVENYKGYLLLVVVFIGIITVLFGLMTNMATRDLDKATQAITFILLMVFAGTIFTSNIFISLGNKRKAIATLTLPASAFEKFLVGWVYSYLVFQVVFTVLFYAILWSFLRIQGDAPLINVFSSTDHANLAFLMYAFFHAIAIYGAIYFKKMHYAKTAFAFFMIMLVIYLCNDAILSSIIHHKVTSQPFAGLRFMAVDYHTYYHDFYVVASPTSNYIASIFLFLVSLIIWAATYFRLKEKQI